MRDVRIRGRDVGQRAGAFGQGAHRGEHAAHVGMVDDRYRLLRRAVNRAALHAVLRIGDGQLIRAVRHGDALHADPEARRVHHDEHVFEAAIFLADHIADRAAVVAVLQDGGRARLDAELVFDRDAMHVVALAERTVVIDHELRHEQQRNAFHAFRGVRRAGQHEMRDVLRHVVFAVGDEDLRAEHLERAVALRLGARADEREIGAGLRLGEVHRAGPLACDELRQVALLQFVGTRGEQRFDGAIGQERTQRERNVRGVHHFDAGRGDQFGQRLSAELGRMHHALPAAFAELAERVLEAGRRRDDAVGKRARVLVAFEVERRQHLAVEFRGFVEHGLRGFERGVLEARQRGYFFDVGEFVDNEQHVFQRRGIAHLGVSVIWVLARERCAPQNPIDAS